MEERKFVCKYCSRKFPCGKSLGGHIRTHMNEYSAQAKEEKSNAAMLKFDAMRKKRDSLRYGDGAAGSPTYGLRENPKKTMKFVHSNATNNVQQQFDKFCKECGRGFPSLKALCGHMACHSEKQKLVLDSHSEVENNFAARRSKRMRFNNISSNNSSNNNHLFSSLANGSSSVSEVEQEQEEVAKCLMMLSKDSTYHNGSRIDFFAEPSDNNSVVLEAKSPSLDTKFTAKNVQNSVSNAHRYEEKKLQLHGMKYKSVEMGYQSHNSDSGYVRYGPKKPKKVDSTDSNDGFFRSEVKSSKVRNMTGFDDYDVELGKLVSGNFEDGKEDGGIRRFASKRRLIYDSLGSKKVANGCNNDETYKSKGWKYESFNTERENGYDNDSAYEIDENSNDSDSYPGAKPNNSKVLNGKKSSKGKMLKSKKNKEHECPICNRIFRSGQALGGHKRSHFVVSSEKNTLVIRPAGPPPAPCLIDLNLPAPVDE